MKKLRLYFAAFAAVLALTAAPMLLLPGCGSAPKVAFQTTSVGAITSESALTAWGHYVDQFHPPVSQEAQVKAAFDKYKAASLAVVDAGEALAKGAGSQNSLDLAITAASASFGDLINLLQQFGVVLPAATAP